MAVMTLLGRILISIIFISAGLHKLFGFNGTVAAMAQHQMPATTVLAVGAIILELGGGLCVLLGYRVRVMAVALALFLVPTTIIFHTGLAVAQPFDTAHVVSNLAIMGGLLILAAHGAGGISLDARA